MNGIDTRSAIELLESRIAPAGLIAVDFTGDALELTSIDGGSHEFSIRRLDATTVLLSGVNGTLFQMDGADTSIVLLKTPIRSLSVNLGDGEDTVLLEGLNLDGNIQIDLGAGENALSLEGIETLGSLGIKGGAGSDEIAFIGGLNSVKKDLRVELGSGDNGFEHDATLLQVGRNFFYTGGANGDALRLSGSLTVKGNTDIAWGGGANTLEATGAVRIAFGKNLNFDSSTSAEGDTTSIEFSAYTTEILGTLKIRDGDGVLELAKESNALSSRVGSIDVVTGGGESAIALESAQLSLKSLKVDASASSSSTLEIGGFVGVVGGMSIKKVEYIGGAGEDNVQALIPGATSSGKAPSFKADLGDGDNTVLFVSASGSFKNVDLAAGAGDDIFQVSVLNGKVGGIKIDAGVGGANTEFNLVNSKVTKEVKVTSGPSPESTGLHLGLFNSQIGSLSYVSQAEQNYVYFAGQSMGGEAPSNGFTVKKAITIELGDVYNVVEFEGVTNAKVGKGIKIDMGNGTNDVHGAVGNFVTKSLTVTGGSGFNRVDLSGSGNLGKVELTLEGTGNLVAFQGGVVPLTLKSLDLVSSATSPLDTLTLARVQVLGKVEATLGEGSSALTIDDSVIKGPFIADTGAGADVVSIDTADSNTGTVFFKPVTLDLGDGDDSLTLAGNGTSQLLTAKSKFKADGGEGTDTLTNSAENIFAKEPVFVNLP